ncbi:MULTISPECIES: dihydroxyacetone kinase subunit DhaL [Fusobacterium]|uniref:dihydroxyacetone kinase subunit DhaL n=1 Tax=Fusobacterium TaxID=848 RepID=UPI0025B9C320|nr:dihydroxyacetone kinase subunit DhaL [Fusobacterium sp.]MDD7391846.1 dihydroxyacetone kinase subunit DhaL [Fusobacteriaceae bacterium]MDY5306089.1 dihydroxyacetone kinase subunit DhaL [Fusobacterium gastrosuis]MCI5725239.1 dihydroxyacetone kinase subunit L [Fusobacterium sp.]MCI7223321.1 dihydroxyacetone kinase subunit L [Fusobacterium sp.]MDD7410530.1 dihydroxyacetone kinase subunit DhaL [Fusobacteriaceae bacterium]
MKKYLEILNKIADEINRNQEELTDLDREIGDGDHGVNIDRGFSEIKKILPTFENLSTSEVFSKIGMTLLTKVGGASGAIYGTAFMNAGIYLKGKENITDEIIVETLKSMIDGIQKRGKAIQGEKTMLDTIIPVYEFLNGAINSGKTLEEIKNDVLAIARNAMESTKDIIATKGRAAYLGERSKGHIDPGAMSSYIMIKVICENI